MADCWAAVAPQAARTIAMPQVKDAMPVRVALVRIVFAFISFPPRVDAAKVGTVSLLENAGIAYLHYLIAVARVRTRCLGRLPLLRECNHGEQRRPGPPSHRRAQRAPAGCAGTGGT